MIIYVVIGGVKLITFNLPLEKKGNYWLSYNDKDSDRVNLANITVDNEEWLMHPNDGFELYEQGKVVDSCNLKDSSFYFLKNTIDSTITTIFCSNVFEDLPFYDIVGRNEILIGSDPSCNIVYNNMQIAGVQAKITVSGSQVYITNMDNTKTNIFVSRALVTKENYLVRNGDVIFIMGLKIIIVGTMVIINNPLNTVSTNLPTFNKEFILDDSPEVEDDDANVSVYTKKDYFSRSPQFRSAITPLKIKIATPPQKEKEDDTPTILVVGPMLTMGMVSVVMLFSALGNLGSGKGSALSTVPQIIMAVAMIGTMVFWPTMTRKYKELKYDEDESKRRDKYEVYIQSLRKEIVNNISLQRQILLGNYISVNECTQIILNKNTKLWGRKIEDADFLVVRLGLGTVPLEINLDYQLEDFSLEEDVLKDIVKDLVAESHDITDAPVTVSLFEKRITGLVGNYELTKEFLKSLLIQLLTFYSADILKIVVLSNEENSHNWTWLKELEHCWDNEKVNRFFATKRSDAQEIFKYLEKIYDSRYEQKSESKKTPTPYFLIICDDYKMVAENNFIKKVLTSDDNFGFSTVILSDVISRLPNECSCFINVNKDVSGLIENELVSSNQKQFVAEFVSDEDILKCSQILANIPIIFDNLSKGLPDSCDLLEIYNVGRVEGLNSFNRWKQNDPTISLSAPIGIDINGDLFALDLHEKFHGPHGLIAGMTGSGKSEFINTLVLSLAINYHPNEVAFVLIDYKGGGTALAFENKELGIRLPHIAGTITNLDVTELNRALSSIEAELRRRQKEFNKARDISGESTIDIYKYQKLYREGIVKKPIPHLLLICDEFAELKDQQPDFMDQLISTARIGRSLGVHLILATQKPSGVVNDQIWSNAKFKVCLKVQDKADSKDMIQVADAAEIKQVGRFYLLVGYNDYFAMGQSAYCGMPYVPSDVIKKSVDTSLNFINEVGYIIKSVDEVKKVETKSQGEVLLNVVKYLADIAQEENIVVDRLWLDRIPNIIYVNDIIKKYNYQKENYVINPVIGEYDDPSNQRQGIVTLPLSSVGNSIIYGIPGSGKENLISTIIYSSLITYTTEEINFYVIDCGAETLKTYSPAPQVGDVIFASENEKVNNCFSMINEELSIRKKMFADFSGDINVYNKYSENKKPFIIFVINGYENFMESYNNFEENMIKLTREGTKCGIIFVVSCSSIGSLRAKVRQNFSYSICLKLNDAYDYTNIFGTREKIIPSDNLGRGLIKIDNIYEFQSAMICPEETKLDFLRELCKKLNESISLKAPKVPILPDNVYFDYFDDLSSCTLSNVPIGVEKESLKVSYFNFWDNPLNLILSSMIKNLDSFISGLIQTLQQISKVQIIFLDAGKVLKNNPLGNNYTNTDFNTAVQNILKSITLSNADNKVILMITGINSLLESLEMDVKKEFTDTISKIKEVPFLRVVLIDAPTTIKAMAFEVWLKSNIDATNGIWVGKGITEQSVFKTSGASYRELSVMINNDMGFVIKDEMPILVKLIEVKNGEDVEVL